MSQKNQILLISIETTENNEKLSLINPQDYIIKQGDIGFAIARDFSDIESLSSPTAYST